MKIIVTFKCERETLEKLREVAKKEDRSVSSMLRKIIENYLSNENR